VDAAFEVAVARQHARADDVAARDGLRDLGLQRPGVADAGRAAVADGVEADRLKVVDELSLLEVIRNDARARCETGLDPGLGLQALRRGIALVQLVIEAIRIEPSLIATSAPSSFATALPPWSRFATVSARIFS
jgi:hypothetical protein